MPTAGPPDLGPIAGPAFATLPEHGGPLDPRPPTLGLLLVVCGACSEHAVKTLEDEDRPPDSGVDPDPPADAPTCAITAPADGALIAAGEATVLAATVGDAQQAPESLGVEWASDHDGVLAVSTPGSDGGVSFTTTDLSAAVHVLTLRVTDDDGHTCVDTRTLTVGAPPSVIITAPDDGAGAPEGEAVELRVEIADDDNNVDDLTLVWTSDLDGALPAPAGAGDPVTATLGPGAHVLTATVTDPLGLSDADTVRFTVDGLPTAPVVSITPDPPTTVDTLEAVLDSPSVDPEGATVRYTWVWTVDGVVDPAHTTATIDAAATVRGQVWAVEVTPDDGALSGPSASSAVTIANGLPEVADVVLSPALPTTVDDIDVSWSTADLDDDPVAVTLGWTVDGVAAGSGATPLGSAAFVKDQVVEVTLTPHDGIDAGAPVTASVTIENTPPDAPTVTITPAAPDGSADLVCGATAADVDGDSLTWTLAWTVDGVAFSGATTTTWTGDTVPASSLAVMGTWTCTATPDDGDDVGPPGSASVTICDGDGDGHGAEDCGGEDCDDADPSRHPDAGEVCGDGVDSDCDGADGLCTHDTEMDLGDAWVKLWGENPDDFAGFSVGMADLSGDGLADLLVGAYNTPHGGRAYVIEGPVTADRLLAWSDEYWTAASGYADLGISLEPVGDLDGDGYEEALVGARYANGATGAAYLLSGPIDGGGYVTGADAAFLGVTSSDAAGFAVAPAGDVDGDGQGDVWVGIYGDDGAAADAGAAALFLGPVSGSVSTAAADARLTGEAASNYAGFALDGAGDVNGDGLSDAIIGSYHNDSETGAAYLVYGPMTGAVSLSDADAKLTGSAPGDLVGYATAGRGDIDGDGLDDLAVGSIVYDGLGTDSGAAWLVWGAVSGVQPIADVADAIHYGEHDRYQAGYDVSVACDIDGDGQHDVVIGGNGDTTGGPWAGAVHVITDPRPGTWSLASSEIILTGEQTWDMIGNDLSCEGDADGDGADDLLIGALGDDTQGTNAGAAYLVLANQL